MSLESCLYEGMVRHRRFEPVEHGFRKQIQLLYLDLEERDRVFEGSRLWSNEGRAPIRFRRRDHLGPPTEALADSVDRLLETRLGRPAGGPIRLLTSPSHFGLAFNPVSLYYCFDASGAALDALVAEVTNTPWGERHCYVLDLADIESKRGRVLETGSSKRFHVSPFMEMGMEYDWQIGVPSRSLTLSIRSQLRDRPPSSKRMHGAPYFQADLALSRREIDAGQLRRAFWRDPFLSGRILLGIYGQALRLAAKRVPWVRHPERRWPREFEDPALLGPDPERTSPVHEVLSA